MRKEYVCKICGYAFNGDEGCVEVQSIINPWHKEFHIYCPVCGAQSYEPSMTCKRCGESFRSKDLIGGWYCMDCINEMTNTHHEHAYIFENPEVLEDYAEWLHDRRAKNEDKPTADTTDASRC